MKIMNIKFLPVLVLSVLCNYSVVFAQIRYMDDITENVTVTENIVYGQNVGILTSTPLIESLMMDVYEPANDSVSNRPIVILLHSGFFLPPIVNGQATGDKSDYSIVEMCNRFAKKGYVAVAVNYRLGWNPVSSDEDIRKGTFIQALYRSVQDIKTAVRYLRKTAVEEGNPYGVGDKVSVGGYGTGGFISLSLASLNAYSSELFIPKFMNMTNPTNPTPYINQQVLGNFEATDTGLLPIDTYNDLEVTMCVPNHVGYSSEVDMVFNAGGALLDISWLEAGEVPIASMQNIVDHVDPYTEGYINAPFLYNPIFIAHGSQLVQEAATAYGNNDVFNDLSTSINDSWYSNGNGSGNASMAGHADLPGLFGMITPSPSTVPTACGFEVVQNAPWEWWSELIFLASIDPIDIEELNCSFQLNNPDMSEEKGLAFANMLSVFFTPRVFAALNADGSIESPILDAKELKLFNLSIFPNPSKDNFRISTDTEISAYQLFDLTGKLIYNKMNVSSQSTTIYRNGLNSGLYLTKITDIEGNSIIRKIIFE